jgi:hypothetical protein
MQAFVDWYPLEETQFPKYYKQAYYLYNRMHSGSEKYLLIDDAEMDALWEKYQTRKQELSGQRGEANYMRREFGDTYWWYYQYK